MKVQRKTAGRYSVIFGIISIFVIAPIFVPLAVIFGFVALFKRQILPGALGLLLAIIGFMTSPILLSICDIASDGINIKSFKWEYNVPKQQTEQPRSNTKKEFI